jgi:hypothetical protein
MGKQMPEDIRAPFNLLGEDAELLFRLKAYLEEKNGKTSAVYIVRMALRLLAEKEGLDGDR